MRSKATVSSKGQITIPQEVRQRLGLKQGDLVEFVGENGMTILRPARASDTPFEAYIGALGAFDDVAEVNAWVRELRDEDKLDFPTLCLFPPTKRTKPTPSS